jgi:transmembrane sensor
MSEPNQKAGFTTDAVATRARAASWAAERALSEHWNEDKQAAFQNWLAESTANEVALIRMETTWERTGRLAILRPVSSEKLELTTRRIRPAIFRSILAILVIAILAAGVIITVQGAKKITYNTAIGGHKTLVLVDGSRIELNTGTVLQVAANDARKIWLRKGEAYFQIIHDPKHPFVVLVGDRRITDLGTKFMVRQDANRLNVAVVEGRVSFATKSESAQPLLLDAGDGVIATPNSISVVKKSVQELARELSWRNGMLVFRHTALADAVMEFNRYNHEQIVVGDAAAARLTIDGTFPMNDVREFSEVAQAVFGLHVERRGGVTVISR